MIGPGQSQKLNSLYALMCGTINKNVGGIMTKMVQEHLQRQSDIFSQAVDFLAAIAWNQS
jgi:hypothetical protein